MRRRTAASLLLVDLPPQEKGVNEADEVDANLNASDDVEVGDGRRTVVGLQIGSLGHEEVDVQSEENDLHDAEDQHDKHNNGKLGPQTVRVGRRNGSVTAAYVEAESSRLPDDSQHADNDDDRQEYTTQHCDDDSACACFDTLLGVLDGEDDVHDNERLSADYERQVRASSELVPQRSGR